MAGHVWEWCLTAYSDNLEALTQDARAAVPPMGLSDKEWQLVTHARRLSDKPDSGAEPVCAAARVLRGGSWFRVPRLLRCACRDWRQPSVQDDDVGFRVCCARAPTPPTPR
jgi:formylglycine-generating enzyme required for sulfatase activity